uniref:PH domain-containing protein n=1 Tax=Steinernema glaseri TaxID=37863 RepID=A0A1I8A387_9BILA
MSERAGLLDESILKIMEKARARRAILDEDKEKLNAWSSPTPTSPLAVPTTQVSVSAPCNKFSMKDKFAELSQAVDDFNYSSAPVKRDKDSFLHGPQKRVSVGAVETRPDVLFCPGGSKASPIKSSPIAEAEEPAEKSKKKVHYAFPIRYNAFADDSSVFLQSTSTEDSHPRSSGSDVHDTSHGPLESTCIDGSTGSRQYAQVHFSSKCTPRTSSTASMKISPVSSGRPVFSVFSGEPSPIVNPQSEGEGDDEVFNTEEDKGERTLTDTPSVKVVTNVKAKSIAQQFEERSRQATTTHATPVIRKPAKFPTTPLPPRQPAPSAPTPRLSANNPYIEEKRIGSVKSLMSRWEVSSTTGAPLHPDQSADELLQAAVHMAHAVNKPKFPGKLKGLQKADYPVKLTATAESTAKQPEEAVPKEVVVASAIPPGKQAELEMLDDGNEDSPIQKSPRLNISQSSVHDLSADMQEPEVAEEDDLIGDEDSASETDTAMPLKELGEDSYIDKAFGFINGSPYKTSTSGMAPIAETETLATPGSTVSNTGGESLLEAINTEVQKLDTPCVSTDRPNDTSSTPHLAHSISFYRKRGAGMTPKSLVTQIGTPRALEVLGEEASPKEERIDEARLQAMLKCIDKSISVEEEHIKQATRAYSLCRGSPEFRGSREEVDAQRALLIAQERRKALMVERDRLMRHPNEPRATGPRGSLVISQMIFRLTREFVNHHINANNDGMLYYFIVLIKHDDVVEHTAMVTSDDGLRNGHIDFSHYLNLKSLRPDFKIRLELHGLKTQRELISHHEKYRSRKGSQSRSSKSSKSFSSSQSSSLSGFITSPGGPPAVIDAAFQKLGELTLDINSVKFEKFSLGDAQYPLDGSCVVKMRSYAEESRAAVNYRGFLSLYEVVQDLGSWNRLWCSLVDGKLRFWRYPEDENVKDTVTEFDMRWCINEVVPTPEDVKSFHYSMQMDMRVPGDGSSSGPMRILLAADTKDAMTSWIAALNKTIRNLLLWSGNTGSNR